jgi:hypothetical protein
MHLSVDDGRWNRTEYERRDARDELCLIWSSLINHDVNDMSRTRLDPPKRTDQAPVLVLSNNYWESAILRRG